MSPLESPPLGPPPPGPPSLRLLDIEHFLVIRYTAIAACTWLFYDHVLTVGREIELVWKAPSSFAKYGFLIHRYASPICVTILLYTLSGTAVRLSKAMCQHSAPATSLLTVVFVVLADVIAVLHVSSLWRHNATVLKTLISIFTITSIVTAVCTGIAVSKLIPSVQYIPQPDVCVATLTPTLLAVPWASGLFFDLGMLIFTIWSTCNRLQGQPPSVARAGIRYFMVVVVLRFVSLVITLASKSQLWLDGLSITVVWPCFSINLARLVFRLRGGRAKTKRGTDDETTMSTLEADIESEMELDARCLTASSEVVHCTTLHVTI